jgi:glucose/arabinose dehydrogenase
MKTNKLSWVLHILLCIIISTYNLSAQLNIDGTLVDMKPVQQNLDTPWEILWGPDNYIWITERYGRVSRINPETGELTALITIDEVHEESESGLLGMALHPDFLEQPYVYLVYNYFEENIRERVVRYYFNGSNLVNPEILLDNIQGAQNHDGSRILVGPDDKLYLSFGDAGTKSRSQDLSSLNGKILRMNLDGSIPDDNPFDDSYVWSYGHRNPQGLVFTPDDRLYSSEHGPSNDDEVNLISKGHNYGWPQVEGFCDNDSEASFCTQNDITEPLAAWTPTLAVAGLDYYPYTLIPAWKDKLLLVSLRTGKLISLTLSGSGNEVIKQETWISGELGRLRDLCIAPDGRVFISTSNRDGRGTSRAGDDQILELKPSGPDDIFSLRGDEIHYRLFPNPAREQVTINLDTNYDKVIYGIYRVTGEQVKIGTITGSRFLLDLKEIPTGYYLLKLQTEKHLKLISLVITK